MSRREYGSVSNRRERDERIREQQKKLDKLNTKNTDYQKYLLMKYDSEHSQLHKSKLEEFEKLKERFEK